MLLFGVLGLFFFLLIISIFKPNWGIAIFLLFSIFFTDYFLIRISLEVLTQFPLKVYLAAAVAIGCLLRMMKTGHTSFGILTQDVILFVFLCYCAMVTLIALLGRTSFAVNMDLLILLGLMGMLYFFIVNTIHTPGDVEILGWAIILGSVIVSSFSIWDIFQGIEKRGFGIVGENPTGFFCSLALPFVFALMKTRRFKSRFLNLTVSASYSFIIALFILAVIASGSRGGFLAITVSLILSLSLIKIKQRDAAVLGITLFIICIVVITGYSQYMEFAFWKFSNFITNTTSFTLPTDPNVIQRVDALKAGSDALATFPVFGVGPGVFRTARWGSASENLFLQILVGYGIAGFIIASVLGLLVLKSFCLAANNAKKKQLPLLFNWTAAFTVSYIAMLVFGLTNDLLYNVTPWFIVAVGAACLHISKISTSSEERH